VLGIFEFSWQRSEVQSSQRAIALRGCHEEVWKAVSLPRGPIHVTAVFLAFFGRTSTPSDWWHWIEKSMWAQACRGSGLS